MLDTVTISAGKVLNNLLESGNEAERCYAAQTAAIINSQGSIDKLIDCIYHEDPDVCIDASAALGRLKAIQAVENLIEVVDGHPEGDAKIAAVKALSDIGTELALSRITEWAKDADSINGYTDSGWNDGWDIQLHSIKALGNHRYSKALPVLKKILSEDNLDLENDLLTALAKIGGTGSEHVIDLLKDGNNRLVRRAAMALRHSVGKESADALKGLLKHPDEDVRVAAAIAIGECHYDQYLVDLIQLFKDPSAEVQKSAVKSVMTMLAEDNNQTGITLSTSKLIAVLPSLNSTGKTLLINILSGLLGTQTLDPSFIEILHQSVQSVDSDEKIAAADLLAKQGDETALPLIIEQLEREGSSLRVKRSMISAFAKLSNGSLMNLTQLNRVLQQSDPGLRLAVFDALIAMATNCHKVNHISAVEMFDVYLNGDELTEEDLRKSRPINSIKVVTVNEDDETMEQSVVISEDQHLQSILTQMGDIYPEESSVEEPAMEEQATPLSTLDVIQRDTVSAVISVSANDDNVQAPHLREMVDNIDEDVSEYGDIVLAHLDNGQRLNLSRKKIARVPDYENQMLAIRALVKHPSDEHLEKLLNLLLHDDAEVLTEAVKAIGGIALAAPKLKPLRRAAGPLCTLVLSGSPELRLACAKTLGELRQKVGLTALVTALQDGDSNIRLQAIRSLSALVYAQSGRRAAKETVNDAVIECLQDNADGVVIAAMEYISQQSIATQLTAVIQRGLSSDALILAAAKAARVLNQPLAAEQLCDVLQKNEQFELRARALKMLGIILSD